MDEHPRTVDALVWLLSPIDRCFGWDGQCGRPLPGVRFFGAQAYCANPVSRITYVVAGRCLRRH